MAGAAELLRALLLLQQVLLFASAPLTTCKPPDDVRLHVHLRSHVNATGHRVLTAQVQSVGAPDQQVEVDVLQRESELNSGQLLTLDTVAAVRGEVRAAPAEAAEAAEVGQGAEQLEQNRVRKGAVPDGDFEEVRYADYRPLGGGDGAPAPAPAGLYKVHARAQAWAGARAACEAEHAQLLVAETAEEAQAAARAFTRGPAPVGAQRADLFFVGLSDEQREGHYVTVTGKNLTSLEYQKWHAKEPSKGRDQNYIALDREGHLHDIPNNWKLAFMCEAPQNN